MDDLLKALEFAGKYAWALFITTALVLFVPDDVAKYAGIIEIRDSLRGPLWIFLVLNFVLVLGAAFQYFDKRWRERRDVGRIADQRLSDLQQSAALREEEAQLRRQEQEAAAREREAAEQREHRRREEAHAKSFGDLVLRLRSLGGKEQMWIKYCLFHNNQTLTAQRVDSTAQSLCYKRILEEGSGSVFDLPFHIPDDVWRYLQEHKDEFLPVNERSDPRFAGALENFRKTLWAF